MKKLILSAIIAMSVGVAGCGGVVLPKPNTPQTAGVEALVAYGLAAHTAGQYLSLPLCTSPVTIVPCKTTVIANKVKAADNAAYQAAVAADAAVNSPTASAAATSALTDLKNANTTANGGKQ